METRSRELSDEMVEMIQEELGEDVDVVGFNIQEYVRGDPTVEDATVTGAEIEVTAYASYEDPDENDTSDFRVK